MEPDELLRLLKEHYPDKPPVIVFVQGDAHFGAASPKKPIDFGDVEAVKAAILELLKGKYMAAAKLAKALGISKSTLLRTKAIDQLLDAGSIVCKHNRGYWRPDSPPT